MDTPRKLQEELSSLFKTKVRLYLDKDDKGYHYCYKLKINKIYIKATIGCDELYTWNNRKIIRYVLEQIFADIRFYYT